MRPELLTLALVGGGQAVRPFLNEADTGQAQALGDLKKGALPDLDTITAITDFDYACHNHLPATNYTWFRHGSGGEWSYRNNLESYQRFSFAKQRALVDITKSNQTLATKILGHNFSAPFYISAAAGGASVHKDCELNLAKAADAQNVLYMPALLASWTIEEIAKVKGKDQVTFQQLYLDNNDTATKELLRRSEKAGAKAIVFTIDANAAGNRQRNRRYEGGATYLDEPQDLSLFTWQFYDKLKAMTKLPVVLKGINSVEDAKLAVQHKAPAIIISNHGGRQVDGVHSSIETCIEIHKESPEIFQQTEVWADGGVRYGTDILKLLSLGVKAVGLGRPFMYSSVYGQKGVERAIKMLKYELSLDSANLGIPDIQKLDASLVKWDTNNWYS